MSIIRNTPRIIQAGVSLIELLVGIAVGLVVIAAAVATYAVIARSGAEIFGSAKLNEELRGAIDLITSDIRRAGSSQGEPHANPFTVIDVTNIKIHDGGVCILFAYDATFRNGTSPGDVDDKDYFGYKLSNGAIYARKTNSDGSGVINCMGSGSDWERLTDEENVLITSLTFQTTGSQCLNLTQAGQTWTSPTASTIPACDPSTPGYVAATNNRLIEKRQIKVRLAGKLKRREDFTMVLEESVLLANDRVFNIP
jgi:prepilin peptidase dependent protein B